MRLRDPTAVAIVGAIPFLVIASVGLFPKAYNRYVHAIGRMSSRVEVGDSCEEIPRKFEEYVRAHGTSQADSGRYSTQRNLYLTRDVPESQVIWLYDVTPFDDLQISVRCDPQTKTVVEELVILD